MHHPKFACQSVALLWASELLRVLQALNLRLSISSLGLPGTGRDGSRCGVRGGRGDRKEGVSE